jgi:hypothetical protein
MGFGRLLFGIAQIQKLGSLACDIELLLCNR